MKTTLKAIARASIMPAVILVGTLFYAGCSSDQDVQYASAADAAQPALAATPQPTPNPDQAAGLITRFFRDVDAGTKDSVKDLLSITSADFFRNHQSDLIADYGFISDPKVQIRSVTDRTVTYTLDYEYLAEGNGRLFWERTGRWTLNHGARSGWVLDSDVWDSVHLVGISTPAHPEMIAVQDKVYSDGRHEFTYQGETLSFLAMGDTWHITPVATATPDPYSGVSTANYATSEPGDTNPGSAEVAGSQTHFVDPQSAQAKCPGDIVVWVNTRSGVFHMQGTRWYGITEQGAYECEGDAFAEGDRQSRNGQ
jgi:hypothetical protein